MEKPVLFLVLFTICLSSMCNSQTIFREDCQQTSVNEQKLRIFDERLTVLESRMSLLENRMKDDFESLWNDLQKHTLKFDQHVQYIETYLTFVLDIVHNNTEFLLSELGKQLNSVTERMDTIQRRFNQSEATTYEIAKNMSQNTVSLRQIIQNISSMDTRIENNVKTFSNMITNVSITSLNANSKMESELEEKVNVTHRALLSMQTSNQHYEEKLLNFDLRLNKLNNDFDLYHRNLSLIDDNCKVSVAEVLRVCMETNNLTKSDVKQVTKSVSFLNFTVSSNLTYSKNRLNSFNTTLSLFQQRIHSISETFTDVNNSVQNLQQSYSHQSTRLTNTESQLGNYNTLIGQLSTGLDTLIKVRLVNVSRSCNWLDHTGTYSGRVEIFYGGIWGTICDDDWDSSDARVVCRMLGYSGGRALASAYHGQGSGQIWLDNVHCDGTEASLIKCAKNTFGVHDCGHNKDASVNCQVRCYQLTQEHPPLQLSP